MRIGFILLVLFSWIGVVAPSTGSAESTPARYLNPVFDEVQLTSDVPFGQAVNDRGQLQTLRLDLYQPVGDTLQQRPVVVWAHGGSMTGGSKSETIARDFSNAFAKRGWVVASVDYRVMSKFLPPQCNFHDFCNALNPLLPIRIKEAQHDVQAAVRWLRANAQGLRIHPEQIMAGGFSAGTALVLGANFESDPSGSALTSNVNTNTSNPGFPSNIAATMSHSGGTLDYTSIGPGDPPIIVYSSLQDTDLTISTTLTTCATTTAVGNVCDLNVFTEGGHSLSGQRAQIIQETSEFFCEHVIGTCATNPTVLALDSPPARGQITDPVELRAVLTSATQPLAGRTVTFRLGSESVEATTNADGVARATLTPTAPSGSKELTATFSETDGYAGSSDTSAFEVLRERTVLSYEGATRAKGDTVQAAARLVEDDGPPLVGAPVTFEVKGTTVTAFTDGEGLATATLAAPDHGRAQEVTAMYSGNESYDPAETSTTVTWGGGP